MLDSDPKEDEEEDLVRCIVDSDLLEAEDSVNEADEGLLEEEELELLTELLDSEEDEPEELEELEDIEDELIELVL